MYEELFQTSDRPFRATPDVRFYFAFDSMEQTRQTVLRVIRRAEGPAAVMGGVGLGKSMLAQVLAEDLSDRFDVVRLHAARLCSRRAMLQSILFELQLPYRDLSEGELRLSLMERMEPAAEHAPDGLVMIVDEAQTLPTKLLEELRLITNFARQGQARARLVLLGGMHLEETFALPEMSSFNQRLAARCFLQPMNRQQTTDFVRHQFACVGVDSKQIITRDALENVYVASEGIPRLANQVMDHALILAIANDQYPISASLIQEAWSDLQQLPMGWNHDDGANAPPVEFGSIDDLDQDFELEPEGADDLDVRATASVDWPAPADLEDFGPTVRANSGAQIVFDASTMFAQRSVPLSSSDGDADHDLFVFQDEEPAPLSTAGAPNLFAAWDRPGDSIECDVDEPSPLARVDLHLRRGSDAVSGAIPMPLARVDEPVVSDPFGQDFDEEFTVDAGDVRRWQERQRAHRQAEAAQAAQLQAAQLQAAQLHAAQLQAAELQAAQVQAAQAAARSQAPASRGQSAATASSAQTVAPTPHTHSPHTHSARTREAHDWTATAAPLAASVAAASAPMEVEQFLVQPQLDGSYTSDFVGVSQTGGSDDRLQSEIEDLISQLNFSAFSLETDSVEQISPEFTRAAASAAKFLDVHDGGERGVQYASYPIRRDEQLESIELSSFDDRDLLVIDEEIPASVRHNHIPPMPATTGTMSYPELFQQLRG